MKDDNDILREAGIAAMDPEAGLVRAKSNGTAPGAIKRAADTSAGLATGTRRALAIQVGARQPRDILTDAAAVAATAGVLRGGDKLVRLLPTGRAEEISESALIAILIEAADWMESSSPAQLRHVRDFARLLLAAPPQTLSELDARAARPHAVLAKEFLANEPGDQEPTIIESLVPADGLTVLAGFPKLGKTFLALSLAYAVATGQQALGAFAVKQGAVLFVSEEDAKRRLQRRGWSVGRGFGVDPRELPIHFSAMVGVRFDESGWLEWLRGELARTQPVFAVFDALRALHRGDENDSMTMGPILYDIGQVCAEAGCAGVVVHHFNKAPKTDGGPIGQRLRGSSAVWAAARGIIGIDRGPDGTIVLSTEANDAEPLEPISVQLEFTRDTRNKPVVRLVSQGNVAAIAQAGAEQWLVSVLKGASEPWVKKRVEDRANEEREERKPGTPSREDLRRAFSSLQRAGKLVKKPFDHPEGDKGKTKKRDGYTLADLPAEGGS